MSRNREPRSPYARYKKTPYRYSDEAREISRIVKKTGTNESVLDLRIEHARKFGYPEPIATDPRDWL